MQKIEITGSLGETYTLHHFMDAAAAAGPGAVVKINSPGGKTCAGITIADEVRDRKLDTHGGTVASAAVPILTAGRHRSMAVDGFIYIHPNWQLTCGNYQQMQQAADAQRRRDEEYSAVIAEHTGLTVERIMEMKMSETTLQPEDALRLNFIDEITEPEGLQPLQLPMDERMGLINALRAEITNEAKKLADTSCKARDGINQAMLDCHAHQRRRANYKPMPEDHMRTRFSGLAWMTLCSYYIQALQKTTGRVPYWPGRWLDDDGNIFFNPPPSTR